MPCPYTVSAMKQFNLQWSGKIKISLWNMKKDRIRVWRTQKCPEASGAFLPIIPPKEVIEVKLPTRLGRFRRCLIRAVLIVVMMLWSGKCL